MTGVTSVGIQTGIQIRESASRLFFSQGYEATSLRAVASEVGIKVGSLYNHIGSKEDLLLQIMGSTMDDLTAKQSEALEGVGDPLERLLRFIQCHIQFHAEHAREVFIGNTELRSLSGEARSSIARKRREYEDQIETLIIEAGNAGQVQVSVPRLHAFGIVAQGTHVSSWYKASGQFSLEEIVRVYLKIILRGLGTPQADDRVDRFLESLN